MEEKQWVPLESNPEVLTKYGHALGLSPLLKLCDVWSLDLLDMVPAPRFAVILLFPLTKKFETAARATQNDIETDESKMPFFCVQTIGNACGMIALIHAVRNSVVPAAPVTEGSFFANFEVQTRGMSGTQRAAALQANKTLESVHERFAQEGQTTAPAANAKVNMHFVCFVPKDGVLYELDGRKDGPVKHGPCPEGKLLETAGTVIREKFMALDPEEHRFTILALTMNVD